jgi:hypothetical protein
MRSRPVHLTVALLAGLLCATVAVAWIDSHRNTRTLWSTLGGRDMFAESATRRVWVVDSVCGRVAVFGMYNPDRRRPGLSWNGKLFPVTERIDVSLMCDSRWLGFGYDRQRPPRNGWVDTIYVVVPHWGILLLIGLLAAPSVMTVSRGMLAARKARTGGCRGCGYDLRATPDRCPECGLPVR